MRLKSLRTITELNPEMCSSVLSFYSYQVLKIPTKLDCPDWVFIGSWSDDKQKTTAASTAAQDHKKTSMSQLHSIYYSCGKRIEKKKHDVEPVPCKKNTWPLISPTVQSFCPRRKSVSKHQITLLTTVSLIGQWKKIRWKERRYTLDTEHGMVENFLFLITFSTR